MCNDDDMGSANYWSEWCTAVASMASVKNTLQSVVTFTHHFLSSSVINSVNLSLTVSFIVFLNKWNLFMILTKLKNDLLVSI